MKEQILLIDDEQDILFLLEAFLKGEGYNVVTATDGVEGMEKFNEIQPDIVVTDFKMPRKDGVAVLKEVKDSGTGIDVIVLTGHSDEATAIDCLRIGAYDYLLKPLEDLDVLVNAISRALYKRRLESDNRRLIKMVEEISIRDSITGLYNFRHLQICLDEEIARCERYNCQFCGVMAAVNDFERLNNAYGTIFIEYALRKIAELGRKTLRRSDQLFRTAQSEFFFLLRETDLDQARQGMLRLQENVDRYKFECDGHQDRISLSIGGVAYPQGIEDKIDLMRNVRKGLMLAREPGNKNIFFIQ